MTYEDIESLIAYKTQMNQAKELILSTIHALENTGKEHILHDLELFNLELSAEVSATKQQIRQWHVDKRTNWSAE